jgi:hypothetical protein
MRLLYHWLLTDDFGNEIHLECEYGSLTIDARYEFLEWETACD